MKSSAIKVTYSLDTGTVMEVRELAQAWNMAQSEVIRRSVHAAHARKQALAPVAWSPEEALAVLQGPPRLAPAVARKWMRAVRAERRSSRRV